MKIISNTFKEPLKIRKSDKHFRFFSPEQSNFSLTETLKSKSKSESNSKYKNTSTPIKQLPNLNSHHSSLINHLTLLNKRIQFYENENYLLNESLSGSSESPNTRIESLKIESFALKTRLNNLNLLLIEDNAKIDELIYPESSEINQPVPDVSVKNAKSQISVLKLKKSSKLSSWKSKILKTKEKISELTSEIHSLSESLKQKQLACRKMVVSINTELRKRRNSP